MIYVYFEIKEISSSFGEIERVEQKNKPTFILFPLKKDTVCTLVKSDLLVLEMKRILHRLEKVQNISGLRQIIRYK